MDKDKSRTDLLAAGRKKLQQFRQKKDKGSGSQGKSTKKSGKSEQHGAVADAASTATKPAASIKSGKSEQHEAVADAVSIATKPTASSQVRDGEIKSAVGSNSGTVNTSESNSVENSADSDTSVAVAGPSAVLITQEKSVVETELGENAESPSEEVGVSKCDADSSVQIECESTGTADAEVARDSSLDTSHTVDSGGEAKNSNVSIQVDESAQHASVDITEGMSVTVESDIPSREKESMPSRENINTSLMQEREDQVTDEELQQLNALSLQCESEIIVPRESLAVVGPSAVPITEEKSVVETELEKNAESSSEEVGVSKRDADSSVQNEGESTGTAGAEMAKDNSLGTSHTVDSGGEAENSNVSIQVDESAQHASVDITEGMSVTVELEIPSREKESMPSRENINTSLMQEREDQEEVQQLNALSLQPCLSTATKPTASSRVCDGEIKSVVCSNSGIVNTSESNSVENSVDSDTSVAVAGPSAVPITQEKSVVETELEKNAESPSEEVGVSKRDADSSVQNEGESTGTADAEVARGISLDTSHTVDSGGEAKNSKMSIQVDVSAQHASDNITEGMSVIVESEIPSSEEESMPSQDNINTSLMQDREDQEEVQQLNSLSLGNADVTSGELKHQNEALEEYSKKLEATNIELRVLYEALEEHRGSVESRNCELSILCESLQLEVTNLKVENVEVDRKLHVYEATSGELKDQNEALEEYSKKLEATNIERRVLYEALEEHRGRIESRNCELSILCESLQLEVTNLKVENVEVDRKLHVYESRTSKLQSQLHDLHLISNVMVSQISEQLENFHKEAAEKVLILERHWNSTIDPVLEATGKLDESLGRVNMTTAVSHDSLDRISYSVASVYDAISFIQDLKDKLESSQTEHEAVFTLYKEATEKCDDLHGKNQMASDLLQKLYGDLSELLTVLHGSTDGSDMYLEPEKLPDPLDYSNYEIIIEHVESFLRGSLQLESVNKKLNSELMASAEEVEELKQRCLDSNVLQKLIENVEGVLKVEHAEIQLDKTPASRLESLVSCLVRKCEEADVQLSLSKEDSGSKEVELTLMQEEVQQLNALSLQHESELIVLRESLHQAEEALLVARSEIEGKVNELEQSEQRVSSLREKLTIAVTKGKGLIVQRDGLKQSLNEKSVELERFSQELQMKDARLLEIETKLKAYSESGERVEALESELSYIRNSATALRESFLLKDSVLQRIEEILEDLDLPEHFHSRDIIEKIDWLARTATSNTFPVTDSDQKSSAGGVSYSDTGFVVMDSWKDDLQPSSNSSEDIKRKYDELQSKFYGLAEQNEMLEQSLMERNNIVQRWEEILDRIDMPSHLRSVEPEDRINWLSKALSEVQEDNMSLQQKVVNLENHCVSLTADLEDSQRRVSDLEADLQTFVHERDHLSERLETLVNDQEKLSTKAVEFELENEKLQKEVTDLQENVAKMHGNENQILSIEADLRRLQSLVTDALEVSGSKYEYSGDSSIECLEGLLSKLLESFATLSSGKPIEADLRRLQSLVTDALEVSGSKYEYSSDSSIECLEGLLNKLLESYATLSSGKPVHGGAAEGLHTEYTDATVVGSRSLNRLDSQESDIDVLKKELEDVQHELLDVKEERDGYLEKQQSMASEFEALHNKVNELQGLLNQEEKKSASVREKLNVAVRKGKSLVQQRDSLKQSIDEVNSEVERLRSEITTGQVKIAEYEQNFRDLSTYPGRVEALESETLFLRNCLNETEQNLQQKANTLSMIVNILDNIDVGGDFNSRDPVVKLEQIGKMCFDLRTDVASSEQETRKSKRAAELLLAELNEVQERNDGLQEELAKSADEISILSKERDLAEAGKLEAVLSLEKLSTAHSEERNQFSEFAELKSGVDQLRKGFHDISNSLAGLFYNDLEFLKNLESGIDSCLNLNSGNVVDVHPFTAAGGFLLSKSDKDNSISIHSWSDEAHGHFGDSFAIETFTYITHYVQELMTEIGVLKEKLDEHSMSLHEKSSSVSRLVAIVRGEISSKNESFEALRRDFLQMEMVKKEKDKELLVLHRNAALLFEACTSSVVEINRRKAELVGNCWAVGDLGMTSKTAELPAFRGEGELYSEESVRSVADRLLSAASDFATLTAEIAEGSQKEMKLTISNLQKELQEKDVQKERIFMELVSQIKEAEATASSYSVDLESSQTLVHDLEKQLEAMKGERNLLEQRVKELEDDHASSDELQQRVRSLTDVLAAKDHEIEELMQAFDEEEVQMHGITFKIKELEKIVEQKNLDLENLEASRGKVMKKLFVTVNKFDELHHLSASLLAEVEELQSQLQDRDAEISFLRQEVTRCTNDVLVASQVSKKGNSDEIHELLTWFDMNIARFGVRSEYLEDKNNSDIAEQMEVLKKTVDSILSELGDLRAAAQSKDILLQEERTKVKELTRKGQTLEKCLREKESQLNLLEGVEDGQATSLTSEIHEVEPAINKWAASGSSLASQVRSLRKGNSEQVAIAIDMDPGSTSRLEDEEDDKVHGFKSLTTSRMVPRFTRPLTDMVDGLWVTCDRTLMRQPILRLGIIFYWAFLHTLLASLAI
ncbi:centromere-associated protein E isoform X2 [Rosa chinensis]|uniref:centromere-associated protein E isoform X2 n=1 Tax=Rosa chinensis TaxID=74649 RepID=UPI000D095BC2|nr:centromere-associated protein E isoform X2 [Rosa chinensis]